ncbi:MAG: 4'-phosphopantetheinyl transferase superfamily protein [Mycoplasmataceae bacterium]|jgi:phosphopantetheinyl transferase (holo-ACP synthase)|nr:4'-phosphopantetheinyl transferase superfamily protein [Mycoplasmataceae bacterium]
MFNIYITECSSISAKGELNKYSKLKRYINKNDKQLAICSMKYKYFFVKKHNYDINDLVLTKKPYVKNAKYHFSISHSYPYCVFCESKNEIGIDVQYINKKINYSRIMKKKFFDEEKKYIKNDIKKFYKIWTCKEALYKALNKQDQKKNKLTNLFINNKKNKLFSIVNKKKYYFVFKYIKNFILCVSSTNEKNKLKIFNFKYSSFE